MTVVERERRQVDEILDEVRRLDALGEAVETGRRGEARRELRDLRARRIGHARPVRLAIAADLLDVSLPTVRAWADEGVLEWRGGSPRRVSLNSVLRVRPIVRELKKMGQSRDLLAAVLARVEDEATLGDRRLQGSLKQMRGGRKVYRRRQLA
jgi:DNA-binding transcriptional MerR regulator